MRAFGNRLALTHLPAMVATYNQGTRASELVRQYAPQIAGKIILITGVSPRSLGESFVKQVAVAQPAMFISLAARSPRCKTSSTS